MPWLRDTRLSRTRDNDQVKDEEKREGIVEESLFFCYGMSLGTKSIITFLIVCFLPSYLNVILFLCYISEHWTTAPTLNMTINHKIP